MINRATGLLLSALLFSAPSAQAEWKLVDMTEEAAFYIDDFFEPGPKVLIWSLVDYPRPNSAGQLSAKILWEVDCAGSRLRSLMLSSHPHHMGIGQAVTVDKSEGEWLQPAEDSLQEAMYVLACGVEPSVGKKT